ncbi:glycosyltransferase family 2 protein [Georgenia sunbinii]|uniref:glycosyltransferase family 2 protein n=1 Tax=Georgenia sunbinii TaxID=3117728 RepID=UPI002F2693CC
MSPRVSVICPAFNRGAALVSTLRSVQAQSIPDWELIVVSDGSTDETDDVVRDMSRSDPRIRLHRAPRHGHPSGPCNIGAELASAPVHAYLAHDDHWESHHLEVLLSALGRDTALVYGRAVREDGTGRSLGTTEWFSQLWHPDIQAVNVLFEPVRALWWADAVAEVGGWRESAEGLEDWDLWLRLARAGHRFTPVGDVTARIYESPSTRKHQLACPHDVPLAVFPDPREARAAVRTLTDRRLTQRFLDAYREDTIAWHLSLLAAQQFAIPDGWDVRPGDLEEAIADVVAQEVRVWESLRVTQTADGWRVGSVVATQTAEHAAHIAQLVAAHMPRLSACVAEALGRPLLSGPPFAGRAEHEGAAV